MRGEHWRPGQQGLVSRAPRIEAVQPWGEQQPGISKGPGRVQHMGAMVQGRAFQTKAYDSQ